MQKILLIQTAFIGDVILASSLIEALHEHQPKTKIHFLLRKGNEALLQNHPHLSRVWIWDKKQAKYPELLRIIRQVRAEQFDQVINLQRFASTGMLTACSGANERIGFRKNPFSFLFSKKIEHEIGTGKHEVERNQMLIADFVGSVTKQPKLYPSEKDFLKVAEYKNQAFITVSPTSVWYTKQYPADRWVEFIKQVPHNFMVYLLGGPGDVDACEKIRLDSGNPNCHLLAGHLSLLQSAALMKDATMNYVNDSAPLHLCSAMNAPVRAIFCSTIPEFGFGPLSDNSKIIQIDQELACRPCGLHGLTSCKIGSFDCAYHIKITEMLAGL
ncbi:MAG: glycosyltransferase family 9 protein [Bacteroidales bacterium]|nr:glycosyltransferase family 9 protein [Bacteroidales bacterium]MCF8457314.1 glycosyltransferase family 9 protein [Bacteroidales bacterium]